MRMTSMVAGLALALAACGGEKKADNQQTTTTPEQQPAQAAPAPAAQRHGLVVRTACTPGRGPSDRHSPRRSESESRQRLPGACMGAQHRLLRLAVLGRHQAQRCLLCPSATAMVGDRLPCHFVFAVRFLGTCRNSSRRVAFPAQRGTEIHGYRETDMTVSC